MSKYVIRSKIVESWVFGDEITIFKLYTSQAYKPYYINGTTSTAWFPSLSNSSPTLVLTEGTTYNKGTTTAAVFYTENVHKIYPFPKVNPLAWGRTKCATNVTRKVTMLNELTRQTYISVKSRNQNQSNASSWQCNDQERYQRMNCQNQKQLALLRKKKKRKRELEMWGGVLFGRHSGSRLSPFIPFLFTFFS